jgi:hypothetical protein
MKSLLFALACLILLSCNNDHLKTTNKVSSTNVAAQNKSFEKRLFSLDSLKTNKRFYDSIQNLPKLDAKSIQSIIPKLNDSTVAENMLLDGRYTFYRRAGEININGNKGLILVRVTEYDGISAKIYLLIMDNSKKIIAEADLAEYLTEAESSSYLSSTQISLDEFQQVVSGSDVKQSDKPDSLGINEAIGREEYKVHQKMKYQNGKFVTTIIDTASRLIK